MAQVKDSEIRKLIYTPQDMGSLGMDHVDYLEQHRARAIGLDIPWLSDYFLPVMAGQMTMIIAQTSNYKTGLMTYWRRKIQDMLQNTPGREDEVIVVVDMENVMEDIALDEMARTLTINVSDMMKRPLTPYEMDDLKKQALDLGVTPVYYIGHSVARAKKEEPLNVSNIYRSIKLLKEGLLDIDVNVAALFIDYLQILALDPNYLGKIKGSGSGNRRLQVANDVSRIRSMSRILACPSFVGVQGKQNLEGAPSQDMQIPGVYDGMETSAIATDADRVITTWMPKMTHTLGEWIEHKNIKFQVAPNGIWIKVAKQRGKNAPSGKAVYYLIDFKKGTFTPVDLSGKTP